MIDIYSSSSNLGDNLGLTALASAVPCRIHMYNDGGNRSVAPIFDDVCEVVFDNGCPATRAPYSSDPTHIFAPLAKRHLLAFGLEKVPAIPRINLKIQEMNEATKFIKRFKNPCVLKCSPQVTDNRTPPLNIINNIVESNPHVDFLTFNLSKNHFKYNFADSFAKNTNVFYDFDIRMQAAIYCLVGRYIGCDTGDYHLMLSVGGIADVLVPENSNVYPYKYFHYGDECWLQLKKRVCYHDWNKNFILQSL